MQIGISAIHATFTQTSYVIRHSEPSLLEWRMDVASAEQLDSLMRAMRAEVAAKNPGVSFIVWALRPGNAKDRAFRGFNTRPTWRLMHEAQAQATADGAKSEPAADLAL